MPNNADWPGDERHLGAALWRVVKDERDAAANRLSEAQRSFDQLSALLAQMKAAGMDSHLPSLEEVQEAFRNG